MAAFLLFRIWCLAVCQPENVIGAAAVIICQFYQVINRYLARSFLVAAIYFALAGQDLGYVILGQVMVNSQIFYPLKFHDDIHLLNMLLEGRLPYLNMQPNSYKNSNNDNNSAINRKKKKKKKQKRKRTKANAKQTNKQKKKKKKKKKKTNKQTNK